ncbi:MAG: ACT domain-containing protein [Phycisphaerales bacterium]|nr:MAG: ACT domain-containing protein [Phycisphaerales bacterium]
MPDVRRTFNLAVQRERLSICQLGADQNVPDWADRGAFVSITRTSEELSIVTSSTIVPAGVWRSDGWRALKAEGQFDFSQHGVLASVTAPLAQASIPILAACTFNTDYVLVQDSNLDRAIRALEGVGHRVVRATPES